MWIFTWMTHKAVTGLTGISYKLNIYLFLFDNTIGVNVGTYKVCTDPMKYISKININSSSDWLKKNIFKNEELWWSRKVMDAKRHTYFILDAHYKIYDTLEVKNYQKKSLR